MLVELSHVEVMYIVAEGGQSGAESAFKTLESRLKNLEGREFYGTLLGDYRACVTLLPEDDPIALGLLIATIPGGVYVRNSLIDWRNNFSKIEAMYSLMAAQYTVDSGRPFIEFYRSDDELHLFLPIVNSKAD